MDNAAIVARVQSLVEAAKSSTAAAAYAARADEFIATQPEYSLAAAALAIAHELHALTLTVEAYLNAQLVDASLSLEP